MKKRYLIGLGLVVLLVCAFAILIMSGAIGFIGYQQFAPSGNINAVQGGPDNSTCIGEGCYYSTSGKYGEVYCDGYACVQGGVIFCYRAIQEYCRGCRSLENPNACACTYNNSLARYCERNNICYPSQAAFSVNCGADETALCRTMETKLNAAKPNDADLGCETSVFNSGILESDCSKTWHEIYTSANSTTKNRIRAYIYLTSGFEPPYPTINVTCHSFCSSCNSTLCASGQLCERSGRI